MAAAVYGDQDSEFLGVGRVLQEVHSGLFEDRHSIDPPDEEGGAVCLGLRVSAGFLVPEGEVDDNAGVDDSAQ